MKAAILLATILSASACFGAMGGQTDPLDPANYPAQDPQICAGQADTTMRSCDVSVYAEVPPEDLVSMPGNLRVSADNWAKSCTDPASLARAAEIDSCLADFQTWTEQEMAAAQNRRAEAGAVVSMLQSNPNYQTLHSAYQEALTTEIHTCEKAKEAHALGPAHAAEADAECSRAVSRRSQAREQWKLHLEAKGIDVRDARALGLQPSP